MELNKLLAGTWVKHVNTAAYSGDWDALSLRCQNKHLGGHSILQSNAIEGDEWVYMPAMNNSHAIKAALDFLQCPVKAVQLMRLKAGAEIKPHIDGGLGFECGEARLHIPIITNDGVKFEIEGEVAPMQAGELWYINADRMHSVVNHCAEDRINLVMDCVVNDWLASKIETGTRPFSI